MRWNWNEMAGFFGFFTFIEVCCVVTEKNIDKKLANRISYQIWYKGCLKGKFGRGFKSAKGGPYPLASLPFSWCNVAWHLNSIVHHKNVWLLAKSQLPWIEVWSVLRWKSFKSRQILVATRGPMGRRDRKKLWNLTGSVKPNICSWCNF